MADSSATAASSGTSSSAASVSGLQHPHPAPVSSVRVMTSARSGRPTSRTAKSAPTERCRRKKTLDAKFDARFSPPHGSPSLVDSQPWARKVFCVATGNPLMQRPLRGRCLVRCSVAFRAARLGGGLHARILRVAGYPPGIALSRPHLHRESAAPTPVCGASFVDGQLPGHANHREGDGGR